MRKKRRSKRRKLSWPDGNPKVNSSKKAEPSNQRNHRKKSESPRTVLLSKPATDTCIVLFDENLLERARTQWQFGSWESLAKLERETLQHHPDRAKLALLAAAGHLQMNNPSASREFVRLAQDWGCSKKLISQILIAGVHNSLGRVATIAGQQLLARKHFESAIAIGMPGSDAQLITQARMGQQIEQLRLSFKPKPFQQEKQPPISISPEEVKPSSEQKGESSLIFSPTAYAYYKTVSEDTADKNAPPYIQFDTKSLPRSGLHYMKKMFAKVLEEHFSFCEWYQEPGCCKKMPCALTGYSHQVKKTQTARLRLTKSHDFALNDPVFVPMFSLRRVILVRHPLHLMTSWFTLDQLLKYKQDLKQVDIKMEKIWAAHEPEILMMAYQVLDDAFVPPNSDSLSSWLDEKIQYILGFLDKWVKPALDNPQPFCHVVRYEEINQFIVSTLNELYDYLPDGQKGHIKEFCSNSTNNFRPRQDPFHAPSEKLSSYLSDNSAIFNIAASKILSSTSKDTFRNVSSL